MFHDEITKIGNAIGLEGEFLINFGFDQIMAILAPEPEMETVVVNRWECRTCGHIHLSNPLIDGCSCMSADYISIATDFISITGTFQRPKPKPVDRSAKLTLIERRSWRRNTTLCGRLATNRAITAHGGSMKDPATIALEALGHVRMLNTRCPAKYKDAEHPISGPCNLPVWCDLTAGHEGPHKHVSGHRFIVMDRKSLIEMQPLPDVCTKCGSKWPCKDAETVIDAFAKVI